MSDFKYIAWGFIIVWSTIPKIIGRKTKNNWRTTIDPWQMCEPKKEFFNFGYQTSKDLFIKNQTRTAPPQNSSNSTTVLVRIFMNKSLCCCVNINMVDKDILIAWKNKTEGCGYSIKTSRYSGWLYLVFWMSFYLVRMYLRTARTLYFLFNKRSPCLFEI